VSNLAVRSQATRLGPSLRRALLSESPRPDRIRSHPLAPWLVVATVSIGAFMGQLDASIVTLALPHLGTAFHATPGVVVWVSLSYLLVLVAALPVAGYLADRFGRKLLYVQGFAVFTAASLACGLAPDLPALVLACCVQGVCIDMYRSRRWQIGAVVPGLVAPEKVRERVRGDPLEFSRGVREALHHVIAEHRRASGALRRGWKDHQ